MIDYTFLANESLFNFRWQLKIWSLFLLLASLSHGGIQHLVRLGHDLILVGVEAEEFYMEAIGGVHHGDRDQAWECPRGQFEATPSRELHGQEFEEESGQLLAEAGANATSEGQVVEAALTILASLRAEPVRVKGLHVLEHSWGIVGVTDAVHDTPTFGYLYTLRDGQKGG